MPEKENVSIHPDLLMEFIESSKATYAFSAETNQRLKIIELQYTDLTVQLDSLKKEIKELNSEIHTLSKELESLKSAKKFTIIVISSIVGFLGFSLPLLIDFIKDFIKD